MLHYCKQKILTAIPVLLGISLLAFMLGVLSPGDPAELALNQSGLNDPSEEQVAAMRSRLGLDQPIWIRYCVWLFSALQGELGYSYISGRDIAQEIALRLPVTLDIALLALVLAAGGGIVLGLVCATYQGSRLDSCIHTVTSVMMAIPAFWLALLLVLCFSETLRLLPTSGSGDFKHLLMPAFVLSFTTLATICRFMRAALLSEFGKQYFLVASVRGLSRLRLLLQYALPNAIVPVVALIGNYLATLLGGAVIVESIFALPGIGSMALEAIRYRDYPVVQAYVLVSGLTLVLMTILVDLLIAYINPKVKLED